MADTSVEMFLWILAFIISHTHVQERCRNEIIKVLYVASMSLKNMRSQYVQLKDIIFPFLL